MADPIATSVQPESATSIAASLQARAEAGDPEAQFNLGVALHRASVDPFRQGNTESRIEAFKWYRLAAAQDRVDAVTAWQSICLTMSRVEVSEGNRRVEAFLAHPATPAPRAVLPPAVPSPLPSSRPAEAPARSARILETDEGEFSLDYEGSRGQSQTMRLDAVSYPSALREARDFLEIGTDGRDSDGARWNLE